MNRFCNRTPRPEPGHRQAAWRRPESKDTGPGTIPRGAGARSNQGISRGTARSL
jgi:hypothetical protein